MPDRVPTSSPSLRSATVSPSELRELRVVAIGASAGGLSALERFFSTLPPKPGAAFVVIQHLSPDYPSHMQELLARHTEMPVQLARHGQVIEADHCYLIPPGKLLTQYEGRLVVEDRGDAPLHEPIDQFFRSLATYGSHAAAVILTGTGSDGSRGSRRWMRPVARCSFKTRAKRSFPGCPAVRWMPCAPTWSVILGPWRSRSIGGCITSQGRVRRPRAKR